MASQTKAVEGKKSQQELLDYLKTVSVIASDHLENCLNICNYDGSSTKLMISGKITLIGRQLHFNHTYLAVALADLSDGNNGGYLVGWLHELTKKKCKIICLPFGVTSIFITTDNKVVLGGYGTLHLHQLDVNGNYTVIWSKSPHSDWIRGIKVHNNKIITVSVDQRCEVLAMSDGAVLSVFGAANKLYCVCLIDENSIFTGCENGKVYVHSVGAKSSSVFVLPGSKAIYALELSFGHDILYCGGVDETIFAIDIKTKNTLWQTKCENSIASMFEQDGILVAAVFKGSAVCLNGQTGATVINLSIRSHGEPRGIALIPTNSNADLHKLCKNDIAKLKSQITALTDQNQKLAQERDAFKQAFDSANQQVLVAQQQIIHLNQQLIASTQQNVALKAENDQLKAYQARDQLNALIAKIDNLSGLEVLHIANVLNINVSGVDSAKLASSSMLAHESFDDFFEEIDANPKHHDGLLRLYSVIKKAKEIGQLPVEHGIGAWIAQQGQAEIAARFDELKYTEDMMVNLDPKTLAQRFEVKVSVIKKLQTDFIVSQASLPNAQQSASATGTGSGGSAILMPFDLNQ